jgi:hypothetical protein
MEHLEADWPLHLECIGGAFVLVLFWTGWDFSVCLARGVGVLGFYSLSIWFWFVDVAGFDTLGGGRLVLAELLSLLGDAFAEGWMTDLVKCFSLLGDAFAGRKVEWLDE